MSLLDDLKNGAVPTGCGVCATLDLLPDDEKEALVTALAGSIGRDRLAFILQSNGHPRASRHWIDRHRREGH